MQMNLWLYMDHVPTTPLIIFMECRSNQLIVTLVLLLINYLCFSVIGQNHRLLPIVYKDGNNPSSPILNYIVHVRRPQLARHLSSQELSAWHESFLPNKTLDSGEPRLVYSYERVISGFAARLTVEEVQAMEAKDGFLLAQRENVYQLETTYTPQFLGLSQWESGTWYKNTFQGEGIVIGVLDTGITNLHPSFDDEGMPPPPTKWKGNCSAVSNVTCNRKIIGATGFVGKKRSVLDSAGHGTHVASIAAGNFVDNANVLGMGQGTASGMAPRAHLAIYKVCTRYSCHGWDVLFGMDRAIKDGVDIVNLSNGKTNPTDKFSENEFAIACMGAFMNGIIPIVAAGNSGPSLSTLRNEQPWALIVGATSTDRRIRATVKLGDGTELYGESAFQPSSFDSSIMMPIAYPGEKGYHYLKYCDSLISSHVRGKIVLCFAGGDINEIDKGHEVFDNGGAAMILMNQDLEGNTTSSQSHLIPTSHLNFDDSIKVLNYYRLAKNSTAEATATIIFNGTIFGYRPAPSMTYFSSRGPGAINGGILKPDVVAPGNNILAAWHKEVGPDPTGTLTMKFDFQSGTSMATPHVSGIAALLKNKHPSWPPSFIQSAIITSARNVDLDGNYILDDNLNDKASINTVGAGMVNASNALDPGLVYVINLDDYKGYLCGLGYTDKEVMIVLFTRPPVNCSTLHQIGASELNYPSIMLNISANSKPITIERTVTNVGEASSTYQARITEPFGLSMQLSKYQLQFSREHQEITFSITFAVRSGAGKQHGQFSEGKLEWVSSNHVVTSPIAIAWH